MNPIVEVGVVVVGKFQVVFSLLGTQLPPINGKMLEVNTGARSVAVRVPTLFYLRVAWV